MTCGPAQNRWLKLAFSTMLSMAGLLWAHCTGIATIGAYQLQTLGLVIATSLAVAVRFQCTHRRWPAAVVLVCAAPMAQLVLRLDVLRAALALYPPAVLLALGSIGTLAVGLIILFTPQPTPRDPIARAVAQLRSSE